MFPGRVPTPRFYTEWIRGDPGNADWYPSHSYLGPAPWPCPARGLLPRRDHDLSGRVREICRTPDVFRAGVGRGRTGKRYGLGKIARRSINTALSRWLSRNGRAGQWREDGTIIHIERTKVVVILTPREASVSAKLHEISDEYKRLFNQGLVLITSEDSCAAFN